MPMSPRLLRPRASGAALHPEVQDWITRVTTNGGTASTNTLSAMSQFCAAIDSAGIRSRFARLNLFCGGNLAACRTPLYRATSPTGTQLGNAMDTNNGPFVDADYVETGISGGLKGNGTGKYLSTGLFTADGYTGGVGHLSVYATSAQSAGSGNFRYYAGTAQTYLVARDGSLNPGLAWVSGTAAIAVASVTDITGHLVGSATASDLRAYYRNGVSLATNTTTSNGPTSSELVVFGRSGQANVMFDGRLAAYSFGGPMSAAQVTAYNTAMQAFQAALGREVPDYADTDTSVYIGAVEAADNQRLEASVRNAFNDFIVGCKTDSTWTAIKASCILCGARTLAGALTPLVGTAPTNNGPFVAADYVRGGATPGLRGNASTKFLNTNRADNADGQDDAHRSVWVTQLASSTNNFWFYYGASSASSANTDHSTSPTSNGMDYIRSRNTGAFVAGTHTTGLKGQSRSVAGSFAWVSGSSSGTISTASSSLSANPVHILASSGRTDNRGDSRIAFYSVGSALTLSLLQSRVSTLVSAMASVT